MLTEKELGPFMTIVPLLGLCICSVGVIYTRKCPLLASTIAIWYLLVMMVARTNPFHEANSLEWSENKIDDAAGVSLIIAGMMIPLVALYLLFTKSHSVRSFVLQEVHIYHYHQFHIFRIAGMSFLYLYLTGVSQSYATLHGGICDVVIAMTAIPLSQYIKTRHDGLGEYRGIVMIWNFFGLVVDFCTTLILFTGNFLGYFQPQYSLAIFLQNPISTIILFNVPLTAAIHVLIMIKFDDIIKMGSAEERRKILG